MSSKKKVKAEKKPAKKEKKVERKERVEPTEFKDSTTLFKGEPRKKGGPKQKLLELIPRKGIALKALVKAAGEAELPVKKVKAWIKILHNNGFIKTK